MNWIQFRGERKEDEKNVKKYEKDLDDFISSLKELVECDVDLVPMMDPHITPSGHTIDKEALDRLKSKF